VSATASYRYALICNPTAKSGKGQRTWARMQALLDAAAVPYRLRISEYAGHAIVLAEQEAERGTEVLVAVGGDGTISEVLCGLMRATVPAGKRPALGIIYTGTSPDICRFHGIPLELEAAVQNLIADQQTPIDVGEIEFVPDTRARDGRVEAASTNAERGRAWFLCSVNLGIGAAVAEGSNSGLRKYFGDFLGTLLSLVYAVLSFSPVDFECVADGAPLSLARVLNITVGKNPFIASGLKVTTPIAADDGKMYLFAVKGFSLLGFFLNVAQMYKGTFQAHPNNLFRFVHTVSCPYNPRAPRVEFDGDPRGTLPCTITLRPLGLRLVVPEVSRAAVPS